MNDAARWLDERTTNAPMPLRDRMQSALAQSSAPVSVHEALAAAAQLCLQAALLRPAHRAAALDLLAADALLTHACAAAADAGPQELARFTTALDVGSFERILGQTNE